MAVTPSSSTIDMVADAPKKKVTTLLNAVTATTDGAALESTCRKKVFAISGITTATVKIQGSMDNLTWHDIDSKTANAIVSNDDPWPYVRAIVSAYTSGTITVKVAE